MTRTRLALTLAFTFAITTLLDAQVNFNEQVIHSGDTSSYGIASGDFNNDGILDLVTINTSTLSFYKGVGGGKFADAVNQSITPNLGQAVAADFNRDGKLDLAVVPSRGTSGGINIFLGNGNGTFRQGAFIPVPGNFQFLTLADFNGDHLPDIAVSYSDSDDQSQGMQVYLGQGDGTFKLASTLSVGGWQVVSGDFNADGRQDLAVIPYNQLQVALYLGKGDGTFQNPLITNAPPGLAEWLGVGDFYNTRVQTLLGDVTYYNGNGTYTTEIFTLRYANGQLLAENDHVLTDGALGPLEESYGGDLDGDFIDDLFITSGYGGGFSVYALGNGNATFRGPYDVPYVGYLQLQSVVRDLNGDSRHDVATAYTDPFAQVSGADVLINTSAATNCPLPMGISLGGKGLAVNICAPYNGQVVGQTFTFEGSGSAFNGEAKRMELWIDGKKVVQNLDDQLKATVTLSRGNHTASFVVVDTFDEYAARTVNFTAQY